VVTAPRAASRQSVRATGRAPAVPIQQLSTKDHDIMKLIALAIAASVGLAISAPSFAQTSPGDGPKQPDTTQGPGQKPDLRKKPLCAKPVFIKGKAQCPNGATPGGTPGAVPK
jgi:hypothetical protein